MKANDRASVFSPELANILAFNDFVNRFRKMERQIHYARVRGKERNGEHAFHVAILGWYINHLLKLGLDVGLIILLALVHDLVEIYAKDTPIVADHLEGKRWPLRATKKEREALALRRIEREWGEKFPALLAAMHQYERQDCPEAGFVCAVDKLASELNIFQSRGRTDKYLELSLEEKRRKKRPRILESYPQLIPLLDELYAEWKKCPEWTYCPKEDVHTTVQAAE